jgi:aminoglycoside 6'-N-acetyltransferase I
MIRLMKKADLPQVKDMMYSLWPKEFDGKMEKNETIFVSEEKGKLNGFIALSVRPWVEGANISPCPHIEGWYVAPQFRKKGVGKKLVKHAETWAKKQGFLELTSDVEMENKISLLAHKALGFTPTYKIQYFSKKLF